MDKNLNPLPSNFLVKKEVIDGELYYNGFNLKDLALKYGTPLKITFLDVIKNYVVGLKKAFDEAIDKNNYKGKFLYINANKANYGAREILEAFKYSDGLETSSFYDALYTYAMYSKYNEYKDKPIFCNGYKLYDYINAILEINQKGLKVTDIIDSLSEYEALKNVNEKINVGLRIHLKSLYSEDPNDPVKNDRFGLTEDEVAYILDDIKNTNLVLTTIHFHQRGMEFEKEKFVENFSKSFSWYVKAKKMYDTIVNYDMGGGAPLPVEGTFDYDTFASFVVKTIKDECEKNNIDTPNIIFENGRFSQKDATVNIYKVVGKKNTSNDDPEWDIIDGSILIAMPEVYALGENIIVTPINALDKKTHQARLAGITCDCDDVYYDKAKGYMDLPDVDDLYIALLGTGSYQNSMNGKGGVHHCLLPEEKDILVYKNNEGVQVEVRHDLQSIDEILKLVKF